MVGLVAGSLVPFSAEDVAFRFFLGSSRRNAPQEFKRSRRLAAQPSQGQVTALAEPSLLDDLQQARVVKSGPIAAQINRRADKGGVFPRSKHANGAEPSTDLIDGEGHYRQYLARNPLDNGGRSDAECRLINVAGTDFSAQNSCDWTVMQAYRFSINNNLLGSRKRKQMWYHAICYYGDLKRFWWNRKRDDLVKDVVVPFISRQVTSVTRNRVPSFFNFGAAQYITIVRTPEKLKLRGEAGVPKELRDADFVREHCAAKEFTSEINRFAAAPRVKSLLEQAAFAPEKRIFVVMKFGDEELDSAYEGVIKPLGSQFGFSVIRVDEIQDSGSINQQILETISSSAIVLADLTGERPNCYYEAGFAHAIGKEIVFSVKEGSKIHFDLAGYRFITWRTENEYRRKLQERLESIVEKRNA
jgi:hypothetical protein